MQSDFPTNGPIVFDPHSAKAQRRMALAHLFTRRRFGRPAPLVSTARKIGDTLDAMRPSEDDFRILLHNQLAITRAANKRSRGALGCLYNQFVGEHPGYVQMSGAHIGYAFERAGLAQEEKLHPQATYCLRQDVAEAALKSLTP